MWSVPVTWRLVAGHASLIGFFDEMQLNGAFWSLVIEMRISIIFPLLMVLLKNVRSHKAMLAVGAGALFLGAIPLPATSSDVSQILGTLQSGMCFVLGSLLARSHERCSAIYLGLARSTRIVIWCGVLGVWSFAGIIASRHLLYGVYDMLVSVASVLVIVIAMSEPWARGALLHRIPQYLGHVSYSVYLLHVTVLLALVHAFYGKVPLLVLLPVYLAISFALATVFHAWIEVPSIELGAWLSKKFQPERIQ
jgi:peptidoglycan/LPS O-acetylase OafA/YrhL